MNHARITARSLVLTASLKGLRATCDTISSLARSISTGFDDFSDAILMVESHQARKYELMTGFDLSYLTEQPQLYTEARAEVIDAEDTDE